MVWCWACLFSDKMYLLNNSHIDHPAQSTPQSLFHASLVKSSNESKMQEVLDHTLTSVLFAMPQQKFQFAKINRFN